MGSGIDDYAHPHRGSVIFPCGDAGHAHPHRGIVIFPCGDAVGENSGPTLQPKPPEVLTKGIPTGKRPRLPVGMPLLRYRGGGGSARAQLALLGWAGSRSLKAHTARNPMNDATPQGKRDFPLWGCAHAIGEGASPPIARGASPQVKARFPCGDALPPGSKLTQWSSRTLLICIPGSGRPHRGKCPFPCGDARPMLEVVHREHL